MSAMASQIISFTSVYSTVYSGVDQRKHQSSVSLASMRSPVSFPHKEPVMRKMFPFDDVIILLTAFVGYKLWEFLCPLLTGVAVLYILHTFHCLRRNMMISRCQNMDGANLGIWGKWKAYYVCLDWIFIMNVSISPNDFVQERDCSGECRVK